MVIRAIKIILILFVVLFLLSIGYAKFTEIKEEKVKEEKILEMQNFLSEKYAVEKELLECTYYAPENKSVNRDILGNSIKYNVPYITIFDYKGTSITVADQNGNLSDSFQLPMLNKLMGEYFTELLEYEVSFVQIRKSCNGNIPDDALIDFIQNGHGKYLTKNDMGTFIKQLCYRDDMEVTLYLPDCKDREGMIEALTTKLIEYEEIESLEILQFYIYDPSEKLIVDVYKADFTRDDYYDMHKFDYFYVPNSNMYYYVDKPEDENVFLIMGFCQLDRGYPSAGQGEMEFTLINGYEIYDYTK